jgi:hypothetical protein
MPPTYRFGRKITLPATVAIKHQLRILMAHDAMKAEVEATQKNAREHTGEFDPEREVVDRVVTAGPS